MSELPYAKDLPISTLSRIFKDKSASYKLLLFKSILESVQSGNTKLSFNDLALRCISQAWYAIHFYKLSFGKSDRFTVWVNDIDLKMEDQILISDLSYHQIYETLKEITYGEIKPQRPVLHTYFKEFSKLVPYRLLTPWFDEELKGLKDYQKNKVIKKLSGEEDYKSLYEIREGNEMLLIVDEDWADYLKTNYTILEGWWRYFFIEYLQKQNPTVLSIATKIDPPIERNTRKIKDLLNRYCKKHNCLPKCVYTGQNITQDTSHDHFFPWSFLGSDPIYNFAPTTKSINSSKGNRIPSKKYIDSLSRFQYEIFLYLGRYEYKKKTLLEMYLNDLQVDKNDEYEDFKRRLEQFYGPLYQTAKNQGFRMGWSV